MPEQLQPHFYSPKHFYAIRWHSYTLLQFKISFAAAAFISLYIWLSLLRRRIVLTLRCAYLARTSPL